MGDQPKGQLTGSPKGFNHLEEIDALRAEVSRLEAENAELRERGMATDSALDSEIAAAGEVIARLRKDNGSMGEEE